MVTTLFVSGFDPELEEDELLALVYNNGVVSVSIERDEMHNSLGRARLVFRNQEDAIAAMLSKNHSIPMSMVSFPEPAEVTEMTQGLTSQVNSLGRGSSVVINPEHNQDAMALSRPIYMPLYSFPEWEGSTSQVNSFQEWTIPMTQVSTSLLNPLGSSMYRNPHAQEPMMHHVPLLNSIGSAMYRNPHAQEPVRHHVPRLQWRNQIKDGMARKLILYVANFSYELEEADLKNMFLRFGEVTSCRIRRHQDTGRSRGDGFVHFSTTEDAQRATVLNGQIFNGRPIWVSFAKAKSEV